MLPPSEELQQKSCSSSPVLVVLTSEIQIIQERLSHLWWMCSHLKYSKYPLLPTQKQINMQSIHDCPHKKYAKYAKYPCLSTQKLCNQNCNSFHRRNLPIPFNISSSKQFNGASVHIISLTRPVYIIFKILSNGKTWHCPSTGNCCNDSFVIMYEGKGKLSATTPNYCSFSFLIERWPAPQFFAISNGFKAIIALFQNVSVFSFEQTRHFQTSKWRLCCNAQKHCWTRTHQRRVRFCF